MIVDRQREGVLEHPAALAGTLERLLCDRARLEGYADRAVAVREARSPARIGPLLRMTYEAAGR